jgi:hypothetical protein
MCWAVAGVPFGIYTISQSLNIPLQIQPQLFLLLALITWGQCKYYDDGWSLRKTTLVIGGICVLFAGIEVGAIIGIRVCLSIWANTRSLLIMESSGQHRYLARWDWC